MLVHDIDGVEYVTREDYEAVVERARALDNELACVRLELEVAAPDVEILKAVREVYNVFDFTAERAKRRPLPAA